MFDDQLDVDPVRSKVMQDAVIGLAVDTPKSRVTCIGDVR